MAKSDFKKGVLPFSFVAIPREVLLMKEYQDLPSSSKALMMDLAAQYTGKNNGRLCPSFPVMARVGWAGKTTLAKAKAALTECSFVVITRKGHAPRTAEWIGMTWWKIDYHASMDIQARDFPYLNFSKMIIKDPNSGRNMENFDVRKRDRYSEKMGPSTPEMIPMTEPVRLQ